jgi:hypothetical protein
MTRIISTLALVALVAASCTSSPSQTEYQRAFEKQWQLSLPVHFNSNNPDSIKLLLPDSVKGAIITRAKLFQDKNVLTSIAFYGEEDQIPVIFTADKDGKDIDRLPLFESVGESLLANSVEHVTILSTHNIIAVDSTSVIKVNEVGVEIPGSRKLTVTKKQYRVSPSGKFELIDTSVTMF